MSKADLTYERLTRPRLGLNGTGSLWLAKDHLLQVTNVFAMERYRRWYFGEIQAFVVRRNAARLVWNLVIAVFAAVFLGVAGFAVFGVFSATGSADTAIALTVAIVFGVIGLGFLAAAVVNTAMGPSCTVFVQTPHGLDRLSSPKRVAAVEKLIALLRPLLEDAQTSPGENKGSLREIAAALERPLS